VEGKIDEGRAIAQIRGASDKGINYVDAPDVTISYSDDADAAWLRKGNRAYYGYKIHSATDSRDGFVLGGQPILNREKNRLRLAPRGSEERGKQRLARITQRSRDFIFKNIK